MDKYDTFLGGPECARVPSMEQPQPYTPDELENVTLGPVGTGLRINGDPIDIFRMGAAGKYIRSLEKRNIIGEQSIHELTALVETLEAQVQRYEAEPTPDEIEKFHDEYLDMGNPATENEGWEPSYRRALQTFLAHRRSKP